MRMVNACAAAAVAAAVTAAAAAPATPPPRYAAELRGIAIAVKGAPHGSGAVSVTIAGAKVCWSFTRLKGIDEPIAAHIQRGAAGQAGPVVVPLDAKFAPRGCIFPTRATAKAIQADPSGYYVDVHTKKYPDGAIRGQLARGNA